MSESKKKLLTVKVVLTVVIVGLLAAFVIYAIAPNYDSRSMPTRLKCISNLREIDAAKNELALGHNLTNGAVVTMDELTNYLPHGEIPKCPSGGTYTTGKIGETPICSIHGDVLPK
jgi:hypothetical protein